MTKATLNYLLLRLPSGKCDVRFARVGGTGPMVDMRSLSESLGTSWPRWEACILILAAQHGWTIKREKDAQQRRTQLMWASDVPRFLHAVAAIPELLRRPLWLRLEAMAAEWRVAGRKAWGSIPLNGSITPPKPSTPTTAPNHSANAPSDSPQHVLEAGITRKTQEGVQALAAKGLNDREIATALNISRTSASLLRRGLYVFGKTAKIPLIEIKRTMGLTSAKAGGATCATCVQAKRIDGGTYWCGRAAFVVGGAQSTCRLHDPMEAQS